MLHFKVFAYWGVLFACFFCLSSAVSSSSKYLTFLTISFRNTLRVSNNLDSDHARCFVCKGLSAVEKTLSIWLKIDGVRQKVTCK